MPLPTLVNVAGWVRKAEADPIAYQQRQTIEVTLNAIAMTGSLNVVMILKGGILMGLAYNSPRLTADIDLTTTLKAEDSTAGTVRRWLDSMFPRAAAALGYADLIIKTQSVKSWPKSNFSAGKFPALKLRIGSAKRGTPQEKALQNGNATVVISVDISFNEPLQQVQVLELTGGQKLRAYGLVDLVSEKYRALLQQVPRNRYRRQDVYDLNRLITYNEFDNELRKQILSALQTKCQQRQIKPTCASLDSTEVKRRAGKEW